MTLKSKHKNWRGRNFKTYKKYLKNNEKLEHLNVFQRLIFNQQSAAPQKVPPGVRGPQHPPPCYATVSRWQPQTRVVMVIFQWASTWTFVFRRFANN